MSGPAAIASMGNPSLYDCSQLELKDDHEVRPLWIIWLQGND